MCHQRKVTSSLALVLALTVVSGCNSDPKPKTSVNKIELESVLPAEYKDLGKQAWSAKFLTYYPLPKQEEWAGYYADPFFPLKDWDNPSHDPKASDFIEQISAWQAKAIGQTDRITDQDDESVSRMLQEAVGALLAKARVQTIAASPNEAIETWKKAWAISKEAVSTGSGAEGLNQNVLLFLCAQAAVDIARQQPAVAVELAKSLEIDLIQIAQEKAREHVVVDVVPRLKILSQGEALLPQAALILDPQGETDQADLMVASAFAADGNSFDGSATVKQSVEWTEEFVSALSTNWTAAQDSLKKRESIVNTAWKSNVTQFNPSKNFEYNAERNRKLLPQLFAYNLTGAINPMIESAIDTQFNIDAARHTLMSLAVSSIGANPDSLESLAAADPSFKKPIIDPLTRQPYLVDFKTRTLRTSLKSIGEDHFLLSVLVKTGVKF